MHTIKMIQLKLKRVIVLLILQCITMLRRLLFKKKTIYIYTLLLIIITSVTGNSTVSPTSTKYLTAAIMSPYVWDVISSLYGKMILTLSAPDFS